MEKHKLEWSRNNTPYWDDIAKLYNNLYKNEWSRLENEYIANKLSGLNKTNRKVKILDLGCGCGLGWNLCSSESFNFDYIGVDISTEMLNVLKSDHPSAKVFNTTMSDLSNFQSNSFDIVISIFTSFSYTDDVEKTISEIARVLKPNGKILISVIGKYSFRRICKLKFGNIERYNTRGKTTKKFSFAWVFTESEIRKQFAKSNFSNIEVAGYNSFGGLGSLTNHPMFWKISNKISNLFPNSSHELIVTANNNKS